MTHYGRTGPEMLRPLCMPMCLAILASLARLDAQNCTAPPNLPNPFKVQDKWWQMSYTKEIMSLNETFKYGIIKAVPFSIPSRMEWRDPDGNLIASIKYEIFTLTNTQDHLDCNGKVFGRSSESLASAIFGNGYTQYYIYTVDENGTETKVGESDKVAWYGAELDIKDLNTGEMLLSYSKPLLTLTNEWTVKRFKAVGFLSDPRLTVLLAATQEEYPTFGLANLGQLLFYGGIAVGGVALLGVLGAVGRRVHRRRNTSVNGYSNLQ